MSNRFGAMVLRTFALVVPLAMLALSPSAHASQAYGSINNFDTVNDTGVPCHGFEIEIDDAHSTDITYTYDWNHYGVPIITEDNTDPLHPKVFVRYESKKNPDGSWASFTAVPAAPIPPTAGHQFTDPSVNFGGEHFGVGFYGTPTAVMYNWLIDDGAGNLIHGGAVNISTPAFAYYPPVAAAPAQVQAVIVPPPPPAPPPLEFGEASWVKETRTSSHNNNKVELRDLVSDDPNDPNDRNWKNGEPDEVEIEWQLFQTDFNAGNGGANGELQGAPEDLPNGDEVITRRYDFFKYVGPLDPDTGEALADTVGPDGIHGVLDYAGTVIVGDYVGAQMAGFDAAGQIGLIDHLQDGEINVPYVDRTLVIAGTPPITTVRTGALPDGMTFDEVTGVLSGTPTVSGTFPFTIHSTDSNAGDVTTTYHLTIVDAGVVPPLHITVTTMASPAEGGGTSGGGEYVLGTDVTVVATENSGFEFVNWTDGGTVVSTSRNYAFVADVNRELVANFTPHADVSLADALDNASLALANEGTSPWFGQTFVSQDGVDAAKSGSLADNEYCLLTTQVGGPGTLSFWWKVDSELEHDFLRFSIDHVLQDRISGNVFFNKKEYAIGPGIHTLRWKYSKDASGSAGRDRAWLDQVVWTPTPISLGEALDNTGLTWTTSDYVAWAGQGALSHDGADAGKNGAISDNQSSVLSTQVSGAGTFSFWWKVDSEAGHDWLRFSIDGVLQDRISGNVVFNKKQYVLGPGTHTLKWKYSKDASGSAGTDAAWVDQVVWAPGP